LNFKTAAEIEQLSGTVAYFVGCNLEDVECLQSKTADEIVAAQMQAQKGINYLHILSSFLPWMPTIDGGEIPTDPFTAIAAGNFSRVPILLGTVQEEALLFIYEAWGSNLTFIDYEALLLGVFGLEFANVSSYYPANVSSDDQRPVLSVLGTEYIFHCPTRLIAGQIASYTNQIYIYRFNHAWSFDGWGANFSFCEGHVCHGAELPFVFHSGDMFYNFTAFEEQLAVTMTSYWSNFVYSNTPNTPYTVPLYWPLFNATTNLIFEFTSPGPVILANNEQNYCDFWDSIGYNN